MAVRSWLIIEAATALLSTDLKCVIAKNFDNLTTCVRHSALLNNHEQVTHTSRYGTPAWIFFLPHCVDTLHIQTTSWCMDYEELISLLCDKVITDRVKILKLQKLMGLGEVVKLVMFEGTIFARWHAARPKLFIVIHSWVYILAADISHTVNRGHAMEQAKRFYFWQ